MSTLRTRGARPTITGRSLPVVAAAVLSLPMAVSGGGIAQAADGPRPGQESLVEGRAASSSATTGPLLRRADARTLTTGASAVVSEVTSLSSPYFRSSKAVTKTMISAAKTRSLAASSLVTRVSVASTRTKKNIYGLLETRRTFSSRIYVSKAKRGPVPASVAVVQLGSRNRAKAELAEYKRDATNRNSPTYGGRNYDSTSTTVSHVFTYKGVRVSQSVRLTNSIVAVAVCQKAKGHKVSTAQLNRCSQRIAKAQARAAGPLFSKAPIDYPWLQTERGTLSWTPTVATETSTGCALTQPSDPTTQWCGLNIAPLTYGSVPVDKIISLSAKYGTVSQGSSGGKATIFYVPKNDGPYTDTISYVLRNSAYNVQSTVGTITLTVKRNGNYTLSTVPASLQTTPEVFSDTFPTCAAFHPIEPSLDWCRSPIVLSDFSLVLGTSGIYYDRIEAKVGNGNGTVQSDFAGGEGTIYFKPNRNGPFVETITFRVGNSKLGVWSNSSVITLTVLKNQNYAVAPR